MPTSIAVVGSLNLDLVANVAHLPRAGETIAATGFATFHGGKGANQAIAAARQKARVDLIGCVGDDEAGHAYRTALTKAGIGLDGLVTLPRERTGSAWINVDAAGENQIILVPAANHRLTAALVRKQAALIRESAALLLQLETPLAAVAEAIRIAARAGVRVVLNPSPWRDDFPWGKIPVSTVVVNETEAAHLFALPAGKLAGNVAAIRRRLAELAIREVVITRGGDSTLCILADRAFETPALPVKPVDTVGAGDTFAGTLTVRLAEGETLENAIRFANAAGALATLGAGAQASIPTRRATDRAAADVPPARSLKAR
jgi:ribokinase